MAGPMRPPTRAAGGGREGMRAPLSALWTRSRERCHPGGSGGAGAEAGAIGPAACTGAGRWIAVGRGLARCRPTDRIRPGRRRDRGIGAVRRAVGELIGEGG